MPPRYLYCTWHHQYKVVLVTSSPSVSVTWCFPMKMSLEHTNFLSVLILVNLGAPYHTHLISDIILIHSFWKKVHCSNFKFRALHLPCGPCPTLCSKPTNVPNFNFSASFHDNTYLSAMCMVLWWIYFPSQVADLLNTARNIHDLWIYVVCSVRTQCAILWGVFGVVALY